MKLPRLYRLLLALVALAGIVGLSWTLAAWAESYSPAPAPAPPRLIPDTDVNPYGANFFLDREVEEWKRDRTVKMAREAGIVYAKQQFSWEEIEKRKSQFDWAKSDQIVALFEKYGIDVIARLDRPPAWAHADKNIPQTPPDNLKDYGDFVYAFVQRYRGRVHYIQVWNEPNIYPEWGNRPVDPAGYAALLEIAYKRAKDADPNVRVLSAPLAITLGEPWAPGTTQWAAMDDLVFLDKMYQAGAKEYFDILAANAFGLRSAPEEEPDPKKLNFQRVALARQVMEKYGDVNKAVWINEYGWNASPPDLPTEQLTWGRVTEQQQADYTLQGIQLAREEWNWIGVFNIWYFRQVGDHTADQSDYYFRMVDVDFTPRLVYQRIKSDATLPVIAKPGLYQETDPALTLRGTDSASVYSPWQPRLDARDSAGREMVTRQPGARALIQFWGDGLDVLVRRGPDEGRAWVTLDGKVVPTLPLDANGHSYIELSSPKDEWQVRVPIARDLQRGNHTVELIVGQNGEVALDAFAVYANGTREFPWTVVAVLGAVSVVAAGLFLRGVFASRRQQRRPAARR